jgi:hypothetical protein
VLVGLVDVGDMAGLGRCGVVGLGDVSDMAGSYCCRVVVERQGDGGGGSERRLGPVGTRQPQ